MAATTKQSTKELYLDELRQLQDQYQQTQSRRAREQLLHTCAQHFSFPSTALRYLKQQSSSPGGLTALETEIEMALAFALSPGRHRPKPAAKPHSNNRASFWIQDSVGVPGGGLDCDRAQLNLPEDIKRHLLEQDDQD